MSKTGCDGFPPQLFFDNPRKKLIQKDLGYQFSLSLALYEQWIAQVRNGEAEE